MPGENLKLADDFAADYDNTINSENWVGPQVIFMMINELINTESKILDLGIGTGASSVLLNNSGHIITGIDGSKKMLEICHSKNIAENLLLHDLERPPFQLEDKSFSAVISNGVFHLIHPVKPLFKEVNRLLDRGGYFVFTLEKDTELEGSTEIEGGIWEKKTKTGVFTYKHSMEYILEALKEYNFEPLLQTEFLAFVNKELQKEFYFTAIAAKLL